MVTGSLLLQLALAETLQGASEDALRDATEARSLFEALGDQRGLSTALRVIGDVADDLGRLDEAAQALTLGLEVAGRVGNAEELGACLVNLGLRGARAREPGCRGGALPERRRRVRSDRPWLRAEPSPMATWRTRSQRRGGMPTPSPTPSGRSAWPRRSAFRSHRGNITDTVATIREAEGDLRQAAEKREEAAELFMAAGATRRAAEQLQAAADAWKRAGDEKRAAALAARSSAAGVRDRLAELAWRGRIDIRPRRNLLPASGATSKLAPCPSTWWQRPTCWCRLLRSAAPKTTCPCSRRGP